MIAFIHVMTTPYIYACIPYDLSFHEGVAGRACETHDAVRLPRLHRGARQDQLSVPSVGLVRLHPTTMKRMVSTQGLGTLIDFKKANKFVLDTSLWGKAQRQI